jgi:transposase
MEVVYTHCAGLDVHKKTVTACVIIPKEKGGIKREIRTFETHTNSLLNMLDWLLSCGCTHVAFGLYRRILATSIQHIRN